MNNYIVPNGHVLALFEANLQLFEGSFVILAILFLLSGQ